MSIGSGQGGGEPEPTGEEILYELDEWEPALLGRLDLELHRVGVPHSWEDEVVLVVDPVHEEAVDEVLDRLEHPDALAVEADTGSGRVDVEVLGDLFLAADALRKDPGHLRSIETLLEVAPRVVQGSPLFGLSPEGWELVQLRVALIRRNVLDGTAPEQIREDAELLRSMLRPIV